jgi:hypothetical protein
MARLTKKDLKNLLKECLREIMLEEGLIVKTNESSKKPQINNNSNIPLNEQKKQLRQKILSMQEDSTTGITGNVIESIDNPMLLENINKLANGAGNGNSKQANLFAQLLADTAVTTLQKQNVPGEHGGVVLESLNAYSEEQQEADLEQLSGLGDMSHWAKVAFSKKQ